MVLPVLAPGGALLGWGLLLLAGAAAAGLGILIAGLNRVFRQAPRLAPLPASPPEPATTALPGDTALPGEAQLTVIVPAYNEAGNIADCLTSLLSSTAPCSDWRVLLVDDGSSDGTVAIARTAVEALAGSADAAGHFSVLQAGPRPAGQRWVGKNWACSRAMEQVASPWVLFVDADVRVQPDTLRRALHQAQAEGADLLTLAPRLVCGCLAEWMVQPIMASLLGLGFPIAAANDPADPTAFAAGPFMLFRHTAYAAIGGHRALASEVVEDLALARRIKAGGFRLRYVLGVDALELRMYADLASLWEGWSKNWFLGLDRNIAKALGAAAVVMLMFSAPWLLAPSALVGAALLPGARPELLGALAAALLAIALQLALRLWTQRAFALPLRHWWLMGAGGLLVGAIAPTSVWRTLTGRGWTWKGRSLA
jgi:glycosyltransferase involved in cell wall biosynthesis